MVTALSAIRSEGVLALAFDARAGASRPVRAFQQGCLRIRFPRVDPDTPTEAVIMNTAGGLTSGDRLSQSVEWRAGTVAVVTSQAAERVYRAPQGPAMIETRIEVGAGAKAEWLPQETILFDGARIDRTLEVSLASDARFLGVETILFGRAARGETMLTGSVTDRWRIRRDGRLIYADTLALPDAPAHWLARAAGGAVACATVLLAGPAAGAMLAPLRAMLAEAPCPAVATAWNELLVARFLATDGQSLRIALMSALTYLRGFPLPRVWTC